MISQNIAGSDAIITLLLLDKFGNTIASFVNGILVPVFRVRSEDEPFNLGSHIMEQLLESCPHTTAGYAAFDVLRAKGKINVEIDIPNKALERIFQHAQKKLGQTLVRYCGTDIEFSEVVRQETISKALFLGVIGLTTPAVYFYSHGAIDDRTSSVKQYVKDLEKSKYWIGRKLSSLECLVSPCMKLAANGAGVASVILFCQATGWMRGGDPGWKDGYNLGVKMALSTAFLSTIPAFYRASLKKILTPST